MAPDNPYSPTRHPLNVKMQPLTDPKSFNLNRFYVRDRQILSHPHMGELGRPLSIRIEPPQAK
jgi:hypothetical protein